MASSSSINNENFGIVRDQTPFTKIVPEGTILSKTQHHQNHRVGDLRLHYDEEEHENSQNSPMKQEEAFCNCYQYSHTTTNNQQSTPHFQPSRQTQQNTEIQKQGFRYAEYRSRKDLLQDIMGLQETTEYFKDRKVVCQKFNSALEDVVQNWCSFNAYMYIDKDEITLYNLKPKQLNSNEFVEKKMEHQSIRKNQKQTFGFSKELIDNKDLFQIQKSSASCKISDIVGFMYGGQSSRFWLLRKYLISMPMGKSLKFNSLFSWNCITLQLKNRDVDIVIQNDHDMKVFIRHLVFSLKTIDGRRDTGKKLLETLIRQEQLAYKKSVNQKNISQRVQDKISAQCELRIFNKICFKYHIILVRNKISYIAFQKCKTIAELILNQIIDTYEVVCQEIESSLNSQSNHNYRKDNYIDYILSLEPGIIKELASQNMKEMRYTTTNNIQLQYNKQNNNPQAMYFSMLNQNDKSQSIKMNSVIKNQKNDSIMQQEDEDAPSIMDRVDHGTPVVNLGISIPNLENPVGLNEDEEILDREQRNQNKIQMDEDSEDIDYCPNKDFLSLKKKTKSSYHLCQELVSKNTEDILMMQSILKKNQTSDMFRNIQLGKSNDLQLILKPKYQKYLETKLQLRKLKIQLQRIKLLINWNFFNGIAYVKAVLRRIEVQKTIFIIILENNYAEANLVPKDLNQDQYPMSFRFYDSIIRIIQESMCPILQNNISIQKSILYKFRKSMIQQMNDYFDQTFNDNKAKLSFNPIKTLSNEGEINHHKIEQCQHLQRSRFVQVDLGHGDLEQIPTDNAHTSGEKRKKVFEFANQKYVMVNFCIPAQVNQMQQNLVNFKGTFAMKQTNLKQSMVKIMTLARLEKWLDENIEEISQKFQGCSHKITQLLDQEKGLKNQTKCNHLLQYSKSNNLNRSNSASLQNNQYIESKEYQQSVLKRILLDYALQLLNRKEQIIRKRKIEKFKFLCDPQQPYELKIQNLDRIIEMTYQSFETHFIQILKDMKELKSILKKNEKVLNYKKLIKKNQ